jgi:phosphonate transport system substrate-binding protein
MEKILLIIALAFTTKPCFSQTLRIAVYQYADNPRIKNLEPLARHLQQKLGITTTVRSYPTVHDLIKGMQNNEADLAFISTFGYLLLQADKSTHPMIPIAALIAPDPKDNYKTAIVSRGSHSIQSLKDLKKHGSSTRIAFVARGSTSGNLVPRLLLNGIGINDAEKHFSTVQYAGTHARAIELLLSDSVDVAAMGRTEWDKLDSAKKAKLRLLHLSSEIPLGPVLLNKEVDNTLKQQIIQTLLRLHETDRPALDAIKLAWSEAKQATQFISIGSNYYIPYLKQFGNLKETQEIIRAFVHQ